MLLLFPGVVDSSNLKLLPKRRIAQKHLGKREWNLIRSYFWLIFGWLARRYGFASTWDTRKVCEVPTALSFDPRQFGSTGVSKSIEYQAFSARIKTSNAPVGP